MSWTKTCPTCQSSKVSRHTKQQLQCFPSNYRRFDTVHMDLMGPLPISLDGSRYILTLRDRGTGFLVSASLKDKSSATVLAALKANFIGPFGIPKCLITDNGREFNSFEFNSFCSDLGIKHKNTTAYHPTCNGLVERIHRTIRVALRSLTDKSSWAATLPFIILAINNQISDNNSFTPYMMVFGQAATLPGTFFVGDQASDDISCTTTDIHVFSENMRQFQRKSRDNKLKNSYVNNDLWEVAEVLVRKDGYRAQFSKLYSGPYAVISRSDKYFTLLTNDGPENISLDRLKPFYRFDLNKI